jgi:hypothetical protein
MEVFFARDRISVNAPISMVSNRVSLDILIFVSVTGRGPTDAPQR